MPEKEPGQQPRIIAVANQKGGVGKTTTAINLGAAMAELGERTLIIDLDPQGNASTGLGLGPEQRRLTTYDLLLEGASLAEVQHATGIANLSIVPATTDLSSADLDIARHERRTLLLRDALRGPGAAGLGISTILIDCPPSLSLLTVNAMVASDSVLIPLQSEFFALEGLSQLLLTVRKVRETANPDLRIEGVVLTMYDRRNNLSRLVAQDARETLGEMVFETIVPRNVRVSEAPSFAQSVLDYDSTSKGSEAYRRLAQEMVSRPRATTK